MLEESEFAKQKIVKADHVIKFVNGEYENEPQKELPECEVVSEAVPNRYNAYASDHQHTKDHQRPADRSCAVE